MEYKEISLEEKANKKVFKVPFVHELGLGM